MQISTGYEYKKVRIEMVPLIDTMFLLLTFFIYTMISMTVHGWLRIDLPVGAGSAEDIKSLVITIAEDNSLWVDDRPASMEEVIAIASNRPAESKGAVLVSGDRNANLGIAVELLSGLRNADVKTVAFQVKEKKN